MANVGENPKFENIRVKNPGTTAPGSPTAGMIYYNSGTSTTAEGLQIYREGSSTKFPPYGGTDTWATLLNTQSAGEDVNLKNVVSVSASGGGSYTCTDANKTYCITATAGTLTVNLPTAVPANRWIIIKDKGGTTNTTTGLWTVDASGTETIDGSTTKTIRRAYSMMYLVSDGTNWQTLSLDAPTDDSIQVREKSTPGTYTWTAPQATTGTAVRWAFLQMSGGGGGGGNGSPGSNAEHIGAGGGAGGGYREEWIYFEPGDALTVVVGAAGAAGGAGGDTTVSLGTGSGRALYVKAVGGGAGGGGSSCPYVCPGGVGGGTATVYGTDGSNSYSHRGGNGGSSGGFSTGYAYVAGGSNQWYSAGTTPGGLFPNGSPDINSSGSGGGAGAFANGGNGHNGQIPHGSGAGGGGGAWTAGSPAPSRATGGAGGVGGIRLTFLGQDGTGTIS